MVKPIEPNELVGRKIGVIPEIVFEVFNRLISEKWNGTSATIVQDEIVACILASKDDAISAAEIFDNHYLDIEDIYRKVGWKVEYDKPGYCETYLATFKFSK